jgi:hypothetical protein
MTAHDTHIEPRISPDSDFVALIEQGFLEPYLFELWEDGTGIDPRTAKRMLRFLKILDDLFLYALIGETSMILLKLTKFPPFIWVNMLVLSIAAIATFVVKLGIDAWITPHYKKTLERFNSTLKWLLKIHPMTTAQFPKAVDSFESTYHAILVDLARMNLQCNSEKDLAAAATAHSHLVIIDEGGRGFKVIFGPHDLQIWFTDARVSTGYILLDPQRWLKENGHHSWSKKH